MNRRRLSLVALCLVFSVATRPASAGILVDHISDPANWQDKSATISSYTPDALQFNLVASFVGDGKQVAKIGVLFGVQDSAGNANNLFPEFPWSVTFYSSFSDFAANPFLVDDNLPGTKIFNQPSNPDWLTVVGTTGPYDLRYAEFDLTGEAWATTNGALQGISLLPIPANGTYLFAVSDGSTAIGLEEDWYIFNSLASGNTIGPGTLETTLIELGIPPEVAQPYGAFRVETVPEPASLLLASLGALGLWVFRRRFR